MKLGRGWTQSPPGISYHETSVLIPLSADEVRLTEQPIFKHNFHSHLPHLPRLPMFAVSFYFASFCSVGWLHLPRGFRARTCVHVPTAFPLSFFIWTCTWSTVCIRWYTAGSKRKAPLRQLGLEAPCVTLRCFHCISCCMFTLLFTLYYMVGVVSGPHIYFA